MAIFTIVGLLTSPRLVTQTTSRRQFGIKARSSCSSSNNFVRGRFKSFLVSGPTVGAGLCWCDRESSSMRLFTVEFSGNIISFLFILEVYCGSCSRCINIKLPCYYIIFIIVHHPYLHHSSSLRNIIHMAPKRRSVQDMEMEELRRQLRCCKSNLQYTKLLNKVVVEQVMGAVLIKRMTQILFITRPFLMT